MKKLTLFVMIIVLGLFISGCATRSYETPKYKINYNKKEYKKIIGEYNNTKDLVYDKYYIQPKNKKEKCEMLMEGSWFSKLNYQKYLEAKKNYKDPYNGFYIWDGECKNGKAQGIGKLSYINDLGFQHGEIGLVKDGVSMAPFYNINKNSDSYGVYIRDKQNRIIGKFVVYKNKQEQVYWKGFKDRKRGVNTGINYFYYNDAPEIVSYEFRGIFGKYFFGKKIRHYWSKDSQGRAIHGSDRDYYGFFNMNIAKPYKYYGDNYYMYLYNENGQKLKEISLPQQFYNDVNAVEAEAIKVANAANNYAQQALQLKQRYDELH